MNRMDSLRDVMDKMYIPGILNTQRTFGKEKNKFLYLCEPDDKTLPYFYIPYEIPPNFEKKRISLYITFSFKHWDLELPVGNITQNFGTIEDPLHYYEYSLYCNQLNCSIKKFTNVAIKKVPEYSCELPFRKARVFTIDGHDSVDLDDGLSIDDEKISVYISLVPYVIDKLELWDCFTKRISNIYMPDKRHNMLPSVISTLCSLNAPLERACLVIDFYFNGLTDLSVCKVRVAKNFSYDETSLNEYEDYKRILSISGCENSHDLIQFYMIKFNVYCATLLKRGIFSVSVKPHEVPHRLLPVYYKQYSQYEYKGDYLQITSPIRRLVDIINMYHLCVEQNLLTFKSGDNFCKGNNFCEKWYTSLDFLNDSLKRVRKAQNQCKMLDVSTKEQNKTFSAILFEKSKDKLFKYKIYVPELKLTSTLKTEMEFENFIERDVILYVFQDEKRLKKKIKFILT